MNAMAERPPMWWGKSMGVRGSTMRADERALVTRERLAAVFLEPRASKMSVDSACDLLQLETLLQGYVLDVESGQSSTLCTRTRSMRSTAAAGARGRRDCRGGGSVRV